MVVARIALSLAGRRFATLEVVRTANTVYWPVLRIAYPDGRYTEVELFPGLQGVFVGTTLFDVFVSKDGRQMRITRVSGKVAMSLREYSIVTLSTHPEYLASVYAPSMYMARIAARHIARNTMYSCYGQDRYDVIEG